MKYFAGFKDGKIFHETVSCDDGDFEVPALYVKRSVAVRQMKENKKFDEIRVIEINTK